MKKMYAALTVLLLMAMAPLALRAAGELAGTWKITDVKVTGKSTARCYFCDLYEVKGALEFTSDGRMFYAPPALSSTIYYYTDGNKLLLKQEQFGTLKNDNQPVEQFEYKLNGNTLTLIKIFSGYIETYTLTK